MRHIGLIAGGGKLPVNVARSVREGGEPLTVIEIDPDSPPGRFEDSVRLPLSKFGKLLKVMSKRGVTHVCLAGKVGRPDFSTFVPDVAAMRYLPGTVMAARAGDDALLRHVMEILESKGFEILSAQDLCRALLLPSGILGRHGLNAASRSDAEQAMEVASIMGEHDIGQAAIVADGVVLAVEAQEGTDRMVERVGQLPEALRGTLQKRLGVLAKRVKPGQDERVDLPTIGPRTVELCAEAGLAGIVSDEGRAFLIDRDECIRMADAHGLFLIGLPQATHDAT
ncbi:MAG: UDP-2,3-diacylglucosamine diphosphatase LpxI [Litorimonas sp.]